MRSNNTNVNDAFIITIVVAIVQPVQLINAELAPGC